MLAFLNDVGPLGVCSPKHGTNSQGVCESLVVTVMFCELLYCNHIVMELLWLFRGLGLLFSLSLALMLASFLDTFPLCLCVLSCLLFCLLSLLILCLWLFASDLLLLLCLFWRFAFLSSYSTCVCSFSSPCGVFFYLHGEVAGGVLRGVALVFVQADIDFLASSSPVVLFILLPG